MEFSEAFGITLRGLRLQRRLTQEAFYNVVSENYLGRLERGKTTPTLATIEALASVLDLDPMVLIMLSKARQLGEESAAPLLEIVSEQIRRVESAWGIGN